MANVVPDRGGNPRRGDFYNLAVNRPGTGDKAWQVDAWSKGGDQYLGSITHWGVSKDYATRQAHAHLETHGKLPHNDIEYAKKYRNPRSR